MIGEGISDEQWAIRILPRQPDAVGEEGRLNWGAFAPSDVEKSAPPVRVSVWDESLGIARIRAIVGATDDRPAYRMNVGELRLLGRSRPGLDVVRDPGGAPSDLSESEKAGHWGIQRLERQRGEGRPAWKALLLDVANLCSRVDPK